MLYYITGNQNKFAIAEEYLKPFGILLKQRDLNISEIQSHSAEEVAKDKAEKAFEILKQPLIVNDHFWSFTALNGFPGAYMKYMNEWLTPEDFLNLMKDKENREVFLIEVLCYIDATKTKCFTQKHPGKVLFEVRGTGLPATMVTTLTADNKSIAEKLNEEPQNPAVVEDYQLWGQFADWYKSNK